MKKLIAIAAVALTGAVFAATSCNTCSTCDTCVTCGDNCGFGYKLKVLIKTTSTKVPTKVIASSCNVCNTCTGTCYRKPVTKKYLGYFFGKTTGYSACTPCICNDWQAFNFVLWDYVNKNAIDIRRFELQQLNRFGESKGSMAEMAFRIGNYEGIDLQFAGQGNMGTRTNGTPAIKSISGFCAGLLPVYCQEDLSTPCEKITGPRYRSIVWTICGAPYYSLTSAAYGKWVLAWDSAIVKRIKAGNIKFYTAPIVSEGEEEAAAGEVQFLCMALANNGYTPSSLAANIPLYCEAVVDAEATEDADAEITGHAFKGFTAEGEPVELEAPEADSEGEDAEDADTLAGEFVWSCDLSQFKAIDIVEVEDVED